MPTIHQQVVLQIATPQGRGTGVWFADWGLIVTNAHLIKGHVQVKIQTYHNQKQLANAVYVDTWHDLAFLKPSEALHLPTVPFLEQLPDTGAEVKTIGHVFRQNYEEHEGIIISNDIVLNDLEYLETDASISPMNTGGALLDSKGNIIGINTYFTFSDNLFGFALPIHYVKSCWKVYVEQTASSIRCPECKHILSHKDLHEIKLCTNCEHALQLFDNPQEKIVWGVAGTIERVLSELKHDIVQARCGVNAWRIQEGSAEIHIRYHNKIGYIIGDATLCYLPKDKDKRASIFNFLMQENNVIQYFNFSIKDDAIILSIMIHDHRLKRYTILNRLKNLFVKADHYDNILVEQYGALWHITS